MPRTPSATWRRCTGSACKPGDVHLNISSPGWAKHAWSNLFAPWNAEATVFIHNYTRFDAARLMAEMDRAGVTSFCAPPTVWRMLIQADLTAAAHARRARSSPRASRSTPRSSSRCGGPGASPSGTASARPRPPSRSPTPPASRSRPGSMGRPSPGFDVDLLDPVTGAPGADEGEIALDLSARPGRPDDRLPRRRRTAPRRRWPAATTAPATSAPATREGYITYVGRARRRLQGVRLQDLPVRAGERPAGARGGRRGGRRARPRRRCGWPCPRRTSCWRRAGSPARRPRR